MYKLIAHRGDKTIALENTLEAFESAVKRPEYSGFECDVRMTKDRKLVIYHNPLYKGLLVKNTLYKDMIGHPLLKDVLSLHANKIIMIDVKDAFIDIDLLHKALNEYPDKKIYVISFYDNVINKLYQKKRNYQVGILNYVLNTNEDHFKYDFLCILMAISNQKIINDYQKRNKELFIYGTDKKKINDTYPYYIVD